MKRLRRIIFNGLTVLSLLLCLVTVILWVIASYRPRILTVANWQDEPRHLSLSVEAHGWVYDGIVWGSWRKEVWGHQEDPASVLDPFRKSFSKSFGPANTVFRTWDDHLITWDPPKDVSASGSNTWHTDAVRFSRMTVTFCLLPFGWIVTRIVQSRRTARTARLGCCTTCGYDLRATPDRCPECGTMPEKLKA
jgi:hypothetical protein